MFFTNKIILYIDVSDHYNEDECDQLGSKLKNDSSS